MLLMKYITKTPGRIRCIGIILAVIIALSSVTASFISPRCVSYANLIEMPLDKPFSLKLSSFHQRLYQPPLMRAMETDPARPLSVKFYFDTMDASAVRKQDITRMLRYFLGFLTTPEESLWVNLSPYEKERIIPDSLAVLDIGKDMLLEDYVLKQLCRTLTDPATAHGKKFWHEVYRRSCFSPAAGKMSERMFHKIWIVPGKAVVSVHANKVFVKEAVLKVMMEADYEAQQHARQSAGSGQLSDKSGTPAPGDRKSKAKKQLRAGNNQQVLEDVFRCQLLPIIERQVNEGESFAVLRQLYYSLILATYFKRQFKNNAVYGQYINQSKTGILSLHKPHIKNVVYESYVRSFKQGTSRCLVIEKDPRTHEKIKRRYVGGGEEFKKIDSVLAEQQTTAGVILENEKQESLVPVPTVFQLQGEPAQSKSGGQSGEEPGQHEELSSAVPRFQNKPLAHIPANEIKNIYIHSSAVLKGEHKLGETIIDLWPIVMGLYSRYPQATIYITTDFPDIFRGQYFSNRVVVLPRDRADMERWHENDTAQWEPYLAQEMGRDSERVARFLIEKNIDLVIDTGPAAGCGSYAVNHMVEKGCLRRPYIVSMVSTTSHMSALSKEILQPIETPSFTDRDGKRYGLDGQERLVNIYRRSDRGSGWLLSIEKCRVLGLALEKDRFPEFKLSIPEAMAALDFLKTIYYYSRDRSDTHKQFDPSKKIVVVNVYAKTQMGLLNRDQWVELILSLMRKMKNVYFVFPHGGRDEDVTYVEDIIQRVKQTPLEDNGNEIILPQMDIYPNIHNLLGLASLVVTLDTGMSHLASGVYDIPSIIITRRGIAHWLPFRDNIFPIMADDFQLPDFLFFSQSLSTAEADVKQAFAETIENIGTQAQKVIAKPSRMAVEIARLAAASVSERAKRDLQLMAHAVSLPMAEYDVGVFLHTCFNLLGLDRNLIPKIIFVDSSQHLKIGIPQFTSKLVMPNDHEKYLLVDKSVVRGDTVLPAIKWIDVLHQIVGHRLARAAFPEFMDNHLKALKDSSSDKPVVLLIKTEEEVLAWYMTFTAIHLLEEINPGIVPGVVMEKISRVHLGSPDEISQCMELIQKIDTMSISSLRYQKLFSLPANVELIKKGVRLKVEQARDLLSRHKRDKGQAVDNHRDIEAVGPCVFNGLTPVYSPRGEKITQVKVSWSWQKDKFTQALPDVCDYAVNVEQIEGKTNAGRTRKYYHGIAGIIKQMEARAHALRQQYGVRDSDQQASSKIVEMLRAVDHTIAVLKDMLAQGEIYVTENDYLFQTADALDGKIRMIRGLGGKYGNQKRIIILSRHDLETMFDDASGDVRHAPGYIAAAEMLFHEAGHVAGYSHTQLRGCGDKVIKAYQEMIGSGCQSGDLSCDLFEEQLESVMAKRNLRPGTKNRLTQAEKILIRDNYSRAQELRARNISVPGNFFIHGLEGALFYIPQASRPTRSTGGINLDPDALIVEQQKKAFDSGVSGNVSPVRFVPSPTAPALRGLSFSFDVLRKIKKKDFVKQG